MTRFKIIAAILVVLFTLPYAALMAAGTWWVFQNGLLLEFVIGSALATLMAYGLIWLVNRRQPWKQLSHVEPGKTWSPAAEAAMDEVNQLAELVAENPPAFDDTAAWQQVFLDVLQRVAGQFHPGDPQAVLNVTVVDALKIAERVSADLHRFVLQTIPFSHMLRIKDWVSGMHNVTSARDLAGTLAGVRNVGMLAINPARGMFQLLTSQFFRHGATALSAVGKRAVVAYAVKRAGAYAIELYSGHFITFDQAYGRFVSAESQADLGVNLRREAALAGEPFRVLVLGQTKAGKSSLVNALFGQTKAATDVIPRTVGIDAYVLESDGFRQAIILDSAGYAGADAKALKSIDDQLDKIDMIVLVTSARSAARDDDRKLLDQVRQRFVQRRDRVQPPLVVAVSHIDALRPINEWAPPYNIVKPQRPKELALVELLQVVADDLQVSPAQLVPVCLLPEKLYNVQEGLLPVMLASLPAAERVKVLRTIPAFQNAEQWQRVWDQSRSAGQVLLGAGWEQVKTVLQNPAVQKALKAGALAALTGGPALGARAAAASLLKEFGEQ
jgi:predicted GTPase